MTETHVCEFCHRPLLPREECDCPGSERKRTLDEAHKFALGVEVHLSLDKIPGTNEYPWVVQAEDSTAVIAAVATLLKLTARQYSVPLEHLVAVLATVLLAPDKKIGGN